MTLVSQISVLCHMALVFSKAISFTILYEKALRDFPQRLTKALVDKALEDYNRCLENKGITFSLDSIMDYGQYSQMREFRSFSGLVGEGSLKRRLRALENIDTNLVVIYSSANKDDASRFNLLGACKGRYFVNLLDRTVPSGEVLPVFLESIRDWMSDLLQVDMPEFYELQNNLSHPRTTNSSSFFIDSTLVEELVQCSSASESIRISAKSNKRTGGRPRNQSTDLRRKIRHLESQIEALRHRQGGRPRKSTKKQSSDFSDADLPKESRDT